jgi:trigger factor
LAATTLKRLDPTQVELEIAITAAEFAAAQERAFRKLVQTSRIPGFRPGKAPRKVFEATYGSAVIAERAMDDLVPAAYSEALKEHELEPIERPTMELLPEEPEHPVRLKATVSVRPQIELKAYKGIALTSPSTAVSDDEVERSLDALRRETATLVPVDRAVALGDVATLDYLGTIDGVAFDGGAATNQPTEILEERFIPGFASGIVGLKAGEEKDVEAHFPADYSNAELAGKTAIFHVNVHDVKERELPEIDDAFAQRFREGATVADLRADIRGRLEANAKSRARRTISAPLLEALLSAHDVPAPAILIEREAESLLEEARGYARQSGVAWEDYLTAQGASDDGLLAEYRIEGERRVRSTLLLEAIAKAEGIEATNADFDNEIAIMSRQYGQPKEAIFEMLRPNLGALADGIVRSKTIEFLIDNADVTEIASETSPAAAESSTL